MKIRTDLSRTDLQAAARYAGVGFHRINESKSRTHARGFDVILTGESNHRVNFSSDRDAMAATWDQWGEFLGYLYRLDPRMVASYYANADHFNWATGGRFNADSITAFSRPRHRQHKFEWDGQWPQRQSVCKCGAVSRWMPVKQWLAEHNEVRESSCTS